MYSHLSALADGHQQPAEYITSLVDFLLPRRAAQAARKYYSTFPLFASLYISINLIRHIKIIDLLNCVRVLIYLQTPKNTLYL
jgi:hypothetical protein